MVTTTKKELAVLPSSIIDIEALPWVETAPGNQMKVLMHDPKSGMLTLITRIAPGACIPYHVHEDLEQAYIMEGSLKDDEGECTAGSFVIRPKGSRHSPVAPEGCTMLVFFMKPTKALRKAIENYPGIEKN